jgi:hypothetical protein
MASSSFLPADNMPLPMPHRKKRKKAVTLKLNERCGNVIENKGPLWKTWERSWNVYDNKGA